MYKQPNKQHKQQPKKLKSKHPAQNKQPIQQMSLSLQPASLEQLSQIEILKKKIQGDSQKINGFYNYFIALSLSPLLFYFFVEREGAPFYKEYQDLVEWLLNFFWETKETLSIKIGNNNPKIVPSEVIEGIESFHQEIIKLARQKCLDYLEVYNQALSYFKEQLWLDNPDNFAYKIWKYEIENKVKEENNGVINKFLVSEYIEETIFPIIHGNTKVFDHYAQLKNLDIDYLTIRDNCIRALDEYFRVLKVQEEWQIKRYIGIGQYHHLPLKDLFEPVKLLLDQLKVIPSFMKDIKETDSFKEQGLFFLLPFTFLFRGFSILLTKFSSSLVTNLIYPYGMRQSTLPKIYSQNNFLSQKQAREYIYQLEAQTENIHYSISKHNNFKKWFKYAFTFLSFIVLSAFGPMALNGEFILMALVFLFEILYERAQALSFQKSQNRLRNDIINTKENLSNILPEYLEVESNNPQQLDFAQYKIIYKNKYENISPQNFMQILKRCLQHYHVEILGEKPRQLLIAYNKYLSASNLLLMHEEFVSSLKRLSEINRITKDLKKVQAIFGSEFIEGNIVFKSFNEKGFPMASWYLICPWQGVAFQLQKLLGQENCTIEQLEENKFLMNIKEVEALSEINLQELIELINEHKPKIKAPQLSIFGTEEENTKREYPLKNKNEKEVIEETKRKIEQPIIPSIQQLPAPYEKARKLKAPFLNEHSHVWILDGTKKGDYTNKECAKFFKEVMKDPTVVPKKANSGVVYDEEKSSREIKFFKVKHLGQYKMFEVREEKEPVKLEMDGNIETVHLLSKVELVHT